MDGQGQRGDIISQSGLSNSTESLDSMKALTAAIEAANAQIHGPASQHVGNSPATVTTTTTTATWHFILWTGHILSCVQAGENLKCR